MIRVLLFGRLGDLHDQPDLRLPWTSELTKLRNLADQLAVNHGQLAREFDNPQTLISVNHTLVDWDHPLQDGDEVAFLPPVTGG